MAGKFLASIAALGLVSAPVMARAAERTPAPAAKNEELAGGSGGRLVIALALFAAVIAWVVVDATDDDEAPASP